MKIFTCQLAIIRKFRSALSCICRNFLGVTFCVVLVSSLVSFSVAAFDIYIPGKKEFKLTDKGGGNSHTETKTWLEEDHHVVLHFMDLFGLPEPGVPDGAMKEETAVLATNAALIGNDIKVTLICTTSTRVRTGATGRNWSPTQILAQSITKNLMPRNP